jgi:hypothetical protein
MSHQTPPPSDPGAESSGSRPREGHTRELTVGGLVGAAVAFGSGLLGVALMTSASENGAVFFVGPALGLLIAVVVTSRPSTRWWGVGMLIGFFLALITLGGACVALIASLGG